MIDCIGCAGQGIRQCAHCRMHTQRGVCGHNSIILRAPKKDNTRWVLSFLVDLKGIDLRCVRGLRRGSDSTLRCPKNRSGLRIPSGFSTAAEMECRLFLPPAAAALHSPGTSFTTAPVRSPGSQAKTKKHPIGCFLFCVKNAVLTRTPTSLDFVTRILCCRFGFTAFCR